MCVDMHVLPNGIMHGIAAYNNKRHVSMVCDRGRALSIRVTAWNCVTTEIDLQRSLIVISDPKKDGIAAVDLIACGASATVIFEHGRCLTAGASPLLGSGAEAIDDWIASNMHNFGAAVRAVLTNRMLNQMIECMLNNIWLGGESLDRMCALMTSSCPTPTLMRHQ